MIGNFGFDVEFDPKDLYIGRDILRKLESFPPHIWTRIEDEVKKIAKNRANKITKHRTSDANIKWRKSMNKNRRTVETHNGVMKVPKVGSKVGMRTGTFIGDLKESKEPGVTIRKGGMGAYGIANGTFSYTINAEAFAKVRGWGGYPNKFSDYLQQRGIIPEGGYLSMEESEENLMLDYLEKEVLNSIGKQ